MGLAVTLEPPVSLREPPEEKSPRALVSGRPTGLALIWRLFLANGAVFALAVLLLAVTPVEISAPLVTLEQLSLLLVGLALMLGLNFILLRRLLAPLRRLTEVMGTIDPDQPGRRLEGIPYDEPRVAALATAFNSMLDRLESERRESARVALAAQEGERLRVARELHDEIGQSLTAATLRAERAADEAGGEWQDIANEIKAALDDVRRIARELRPEALDDLGLHNALITLCSRISAASDLRIERRLEAGLPTLEADVELVVYRIAQESLTNVARHAHARRAIVSLGSAGDRLVLRVEDDGRGLPAELPKGTAGIGGMRERALLVGGSLKIASEPGEGTIVELEVPISADP